MKKVLLATIVAAVIATSCGEEQSVTDLSQIGNGHPNDAEFLSQIDEIIDFYEIPGDYDPSSMYELAVKWCGEWRSEGFIKWAGEIRGSQDQFQVYGFRYNASAVSARLYCDDMLLGLQETVLEYDLQP